jgi:uncharacterized protein YchJ
MFGGRALFSVRQFILIDLKGFRWKPICGDRVENSDSLNRSPCCARAASGHAAAAPPSSVMNERRFTAQYLPCFRTKTIAHLGTAGDCCAAEFQSGLSRTFAKCVDTRYDVLRTSSRQTSIASATVDIARWSNVARAHYADANGLQDARQGEIQHEAHTYEPTHDAQGDNRPGRSGDGIE